MKPIRSCLALAQWGRRPCLLSMALIAAMIVPGGMVLQRREFLGGTAFRAVFVSAAIAQEVERAPRPSSLEVHPTARDIAGMSVAGDPQLSPDGRMVVYTLRTRAFDADELAGASESEAGWSSAQQLWIAPADGTVPARRLTFGEAPATSPRFSPDGRWLAYLRREGGVSKIHLLRISSGAYGGGEPVVLELGKLEPGDIRFSPDGKSISFLAALPLNDEEKAEKSSAGGMIRFGDEWRNDQLFLTPTQGGKVTAITHGREHVIQYAWSPVGDRLAIVTSQSSNPYEAFSLNKVKILDAATGETLRDLERFRRVIGHIEWSPDARFLAYEKGDNTLSLLNTLTVHDVKRGEFFNAAKKLDPTLKGFVWTEDGSIVAHTYQGVASRFYRLAPDGSKADLLPSSKRVFGDSFVTDVNRRFAVGISSTPSSPPNPTRIDLRSGDASVVTDVHPYAAEWTMPKTEIVRWRNEEDVELEGVLWTASVSTNTAGPPPLMVLPHGGPDDVTVENFGAWATYFAASGFNVFRPNYRGSFGYGLSFYSANRGRLGEVEFADIESGVNALIKAGRADADRLVYGGWSWGGFCTAYTIAHTTRYRAAVAGAAVTDTVNQYALSDINHGVAAMWEYTGLPWTKPEVFDRASAVRHIQGAITPTLIIHGMADDRVPFGQGVTLYRALSDVGCEVEFLAYPREPHGFREPAHVEHMLSAWATWYQDHLSVGGDADAPE